MPDSYYDRLYQLMIPEFQAWEKECGLDFKDPEYFYSFYARVQQAVKTLNAERSIKVD